MHAERVTVSLPADIASAARQAVASGGASSVSAYVAGAVAARLERDRALAALAELFGGPPPADALAAVRRDFGLPARQPVAEPGAA